MKKIAGLIVIPLFLQFGIATSSSAGEQDISSQKFNAKVARIKAKQRALARQAGTEGEPSGCGGVNVGNVESDSKSGNIDNIVVIQGDVINIATNCKKE